ncbi:MAG: 3-dehydroquinate synthase II [Candidatus Diapherotrites archaeon]|nr:3-dehydroquinate synthase II [Candidatus Diapherotrites archaeon]
MKAVMIKTKNKEVQRDAVLAGFQVMTNPVPLAVIETTQDEDQAIQAAKNKECLYVKCANWKIIPLENLIAKTRSKTKLIAVVNSANEAKLALNVMEIGVDGILLETEQSSEVKKLQKILEESTALKPMQLETATVIQVLPLGNGARSCIDTCTLMEENQGLLVGSSSQGMLLIQAEVTVNSLVNTRPFRVNAGAVSLYTLMSNAKTQYLEEAKAGVEVLIIDKKGQCIQSNVVRNKIEIRPLVLVEAQSSTGKIAKVILQNAETVRLMTPQKSKAVTELKKGDTILGHFEEGGRHFGMLLKEETIIEK